MVTQQQAAARRQPALPAPCPAARCAARRAPLPPARAAGTPRHKTRGPAAAPVGSWEFGKGSGWRMADRSRRHDGQPALREQVQAGGRGAERRHPPGACSRHRRPAGARLPAQLPCLLARSWAGPPAAAGRNDRIEKQVAAWRQRRRQGGGSEAWRSQRGAPSPAASQTLLTRPIQQTLRQPARAPPLLGPPPLSTQGSRTALARW